jgi:cell division septation protein DedD
MPRAASAPGADYTLPAAQPTVVARREETLSREAVAASSRPAAPPPAPPPPAPASAARVAASDGPWKVQLGAFGVAGNAERLWNSLSGRSELAGRQRLLVKSGRLTKLLAGGYPSRDQAEAACASLKRSGQGCLVMR